MKYSLVMILFVLGLFGCSGEAKKEVKKASNVVTRYGKTLSEAEGKAKAAAAAAKRAIAQTEKDMQKMLESIE